MKLKKILISQPEPQDITKSPYYQLTTKYKVELTFFKFFFIEGISASEFRQTRIHLTDYTAVIFNSKQSVDHYFRLAGELRETIPETMKYFCTTEAIGNYLQTYVQYRKRRVFVGVQFFAELVDVMSKHREEKYLFPCSDEKQTDYTKLLDKGKFNYTRAPMYRAVPRPELKNLNLSEYDMVVLFSPIGVRALVQNFPNIASENIVIGALGSSTHAALNAAGLKITVAAPTTVSPSMTMAIENYILGREQGSVVAPKPTSLKGKGAARGHAGVGAAKKTKTVIADKEKFKQLQEERKAKSAARRAARAARTTNDVKGEKGGKDTK